MPGLCAFLWLYGVTSALVFANIGAAYELSLVLVSPRWV
jgi:hypothetical protein